MPIDKLSELTNPFAAEDAAEMEMATREAGGGTKGGDAGLLSQTGAYGDDEAIWVDDEDKTFDTKPYDDIRQGIERINQFTYTVREAEEQYSNQTAQNKIKASMERVDQLTRDAAKLSKALKARVQKLETENQAYEQKLERELPGSGKNSTVVTWRHNQLRTIQRHFRDSMLDFRKAVDSFRSRFVKRTVRQMVIIDPSMSKEEQKKIEQQAETDPAGMQRMLMEKVEAFGVSDATIGRIAELEEQNEQMKELEKSMKELQEYFNELATLIYEQGDILDNIAENVGNTRDYVEKGRIEIEKAEEYQKASRKKQLCIIIFCMALLIIILFSVGVF